MKGLWSAISTMLLIFGSAAVFRLRAALLMLSAITRLVHWRTMKAFGWRMIPAAAIFLTRRIGRPASGIAWIWLSSTRLDLLTWRVHLRAALRFAGVFRTRRTVLRTLRVASRLFAAWFFAPWLRVFSAAFGRGRCIGAGRFGGFGFLRGQRCHAKGECAAEHGQGVHSGFHGSVGWDCGRLKPSSARTVSACLTPPRRTFVPCMVTKAFHTCRIVRVAFVRAPA
jgi:hypothetical protein